MKEFPPKGKEKRELFLGRFQPLHIGHSKIISMMKKPLVVIVKGKRTSGDRDKNPFNEDYQVQMVKWVHPSVEVSISPNGFLPGILGFFRKKGQEIVKIYAGPDRIAAYKAAIETANERMERQYHYDIEFVETPRVTSATKVREAIRAGDINTFMKLTPKQLHGEFKKMQALLKESYYTPQAGTFETFLKEAMEECDMWS